MKNTKNLWFSIQMIRESLLFPKRGNYTTRIWCDGILVGHPEITKNTLTNYKYWDGNDDHDLIIVKVVKGLITDNKNKFLKIETINNIKLLTININYLLPETFYLLKHFAYNTDSITNEEFIAFSNTKRVSGLGSFSKHFILDELLKNLNFGNMVGSDICLNNPNKTCRLIFLFQEISWSNIRLLFMANRMQLNYEIFYNYHTDLNMVSGTNSLAEFIQSSPLFYEFQINAPMITETVIDEKVIMDWSIKGRTKKFQGDLSSLNSEQLNSYLNPYAFDSLRECEVFLQRNFEIINQKDLYK